MFHRKTLLEATLISTGPFGDLRKADRFRAAVGGHIYTLVGNGTTLETSTEFALFRDTPIFAVDAPLFYTTANLSSTGSLQVLGQAGGPSVQTALGSAVSAQFAALPEPMSATLFLSGLFLVLRRGRS